MSELSSLHTHEEKSTPFQQLISFLNKNEIQHTVKEANQDIPFDVVLMALGLDAAKNPIVLQVHHYKQELTIPEEVRQERQMEEKSLGTLHVLNFLLTHTTELSEDRYGEIGRLLMFANKSIPLGSLAYSELEKCCYYQFSYPSTTETVQPATFQAIFNTILFTKEMFFDVISDVAAGKISVDQILQAASQESISQKQ